MKALILLITGPFMLMFVIGALGTIEYNIENNAPVPLAAYFLLIAAVVWGFCAAKLKQSEIDEFEEITENDYEDEN